MSQKQTVMTTKKSLCCLAKWTVAFKHCLLIKNQQKRITGCSVCEESRHTTPIKAPIHMKAISRQRPLFMSGAPCQPPLAPQQDWGTESVCEISATGETSLFLVPATFPPEYRHHFQRQGQGQGPGSALRASMSARLKSPHR